MEGDSHKYNLERRNKVRNFKSYVCTVIPWYPNATSVQCELCDLIGMNSERDLEVSGSFTQNH